MSKPDWKDAPTWANYVARDPDFVWYWFEIEPVIDGGEWYEGSHHGLICIAHRDEPDWPNTLEQRP